MKNHATRTAIALAATSLVGFTALAVDELAFAPEPGLEASKTFSEKTTLELSGASVTVGDQELPPDALELSVTQERTLQVDDTYGETKEGELRSLERAFKTVGATIESEAVSPDGEDEAASVEAEHPLTGLEVQFSWDEKGEEVVAEFAEGSEGDEELLEGLRIDADLSALLVAESGDEEDRAPGSKWTVDPEALIALARPCGVGFIPLEVDDDSQSVSFYLASLLSCRDLLSAPEGEVEMAWKNSREVDGQRCAVFDLDVNVTDRVDLSERLRESIVPALPKIAKEIEVFEQVTVKLTLEGEGEVVWNLEKNCLHAVELPLEMGVVLEARGSNQGQDVVVTLELEGKTELGLTVE